MRKTRQELVIDILRNHSETRSNKNALIIEVWDAECAAMGKKLSKELVKNKCSSVAGIDRDRRRDKVKALFPPEEDNFEHMKEYANEFSKPINIFKEQI